MKTNHKSRKYGPCKTCGGEVVERRLTVHRRFKGRLHEFEKVPVGVCRECGQRIYKGPVLEALARLVKNGKRAKRILRVPVREYQSA